MENININKILDRETNIDEIKERIQLFENNPIDCNRQGGIYIYGETGIGKTYFINQLLKEMNYDIINYDAGNIRNTSVIESIAKDKFSNKNIYHMMNKNIKKNVILMDEIDGMNNGDKGGINTLIKIIRPKKTKKQKTEDSINSPIMCVGNCHIDKKIKELMKVCHVVKLNIPTNEQIKKIIVEIHPSINIYHLHYIVENANNNLRKLNHLLNIYDKNYDLFLSLSNTKYIELSFYNDDTKETVRKLMMKSSAIHLHDFVINDTDRTSVGLLWHENIIDVISKINQGNDDNLIKNYRKQLENICFADYIDRITFQKQIWEFNEMSSLIKSFYNHSLFHECYDEKEIQIPKEVRFTKVLTKYSTEYNNLLFINKMCQKLQMDKRDVLALFINMKKSQNDIQEYEWLESYDLTKLDVERMYRYIDCLYAS